MRYLFISMCVFVGGGMCLPAVSCADVTVVNTVRVSAGTGSSRAENGTVIEGNRHAEADVTTVVDGNVLTDIHEESSDKPIVIRKTVYATTSSTVVHIETAEDDTPMRAEKSKTAQSVHATPPATTHQTSTAQSAQIITNISEQNDRTTNEAMADPQGFGSFIAHIVASVASTITYVLSKLFS